MIIKGSNIRNINIRYSDYRTRCLMEKMAGKQINSGCLQENLSKYLFNKINLNNLQRSNIVISYKPFQRPVCSLTEEISAGGNKILFSINKNKVETSAITCMSLILYCKEMNTAAAIHINKALISGRDIEDLSNMFLYGYANMKNLVKNKPIEAFISGCAIQFDGDPQVEGNKRVFEFIVPELLKRGVKIDRIDIGGDSSHQTLHLKTGKFSVHFGS